MDERTNGRGDDKGDLLDDVPKRRDGLYEQEEECVPKGGDGKETEFFSLYPLCKQGEVQSCYQKRDAGYPEDGDSGNHKDNNSTYQNQYACEELSDVLVFFSERMTRFYEWKIQKQYAENKIDGNKVYK